MVDPIGAVLAVLAFGAAQAVEVAPLEDAAMSGLLGFIKTFLIGIVLGFAGAAVLWTALRRHLVHDHLHNPVALMLVVLVYSLSNLLVHESGLVAVTVMGLLLANQHTVYVGHIVRFKENLSVLLISSLFIVLTARLDLQQFVAFSWRGPAFVLFLLLVVRPASVMVSTMGCGLTLAERIFLSWLAPRGIVAAAVASVFALELGNADDFVAAAFLVIVGTVVVYGLTAGLLARKLGLSIADPQGVLIASAHPGARAIAAALQKQGITVCLVDTNADNTRVSRMEGLPTLFANILSEDIHQLELGGIGRLLALTRNDEVNLLAVARGAELFGGKESYRLSINSTGTSRRDAGHDVLAGRVLFAEDATYDELDRRFAAGQTVKATRLSEEFGLEEFHQQYPEALILFVADGSGRLQIATTDASLVATAGQTVIALVNAPAEPAAEAADSAAGSE